jgi:transcriptional regulator with XRE-family HTH domain
MTRPVQPGLRILGAAIRRHREAAGLSQRELAARINYCKAWLSNIENGQVRPQRKMVIAIEQVLKVTPKVLLDVFEMIKYTESESVVASDDFAEAERHARTIRQYSAFAAPDLLQTPEYARVLIAGCHPTAKTEVIEGLVRDRLKRQDILRGDDLPTAWMIIDETALRRPIGGPEVHRTQLDALIEAAQSPHIGVQVIPLSTGPHAGLSCSFTILGLENDADAAYTQDNERGYFRERPEIVRGWLEVFEMVRSVALPVAASLEMIRNIRDAM